MSRAFVKEDDAIVNEVPERPTSPYPNQITPAGLAALGRRLAELESQHRAIATGDGLIDEDKKRILERDIRYLRDRIHRAIPIDPATVAHDRVGFGAIVDTMDESGVKRRFQIVGEDEADAAQGRLSWVSPLARALAGGTLGETILWQRSAGDVELQIVAIGYSGE